MFERWLSNLKWALVIAIFAGPAFAYYSYTQVQLTKRILAEGVETTAVIDGGESRSGRRSGTTYKIHAIWTPDGGMERAENITVSSEFAHAIIDGEYLTIEEAQIKYLPGEPEKAAIVVADADQQISDDTLMMWLGGGAGIVGLIGSAIFFLVSRNKKAAPAPAA